MNNSVSSYYYPNRMGRIILLAMEEVTGKNGVNAVLNLASLSHYIENYPPADEEKEFSFETIGLLQGTLEKAFGPHGGRGLALRTGRVCFTQMLRDYGSQLGITDTPFRLQPPAQKLISILQAFERFYNQYSDQRVRIEETEETVLWHIERCPFCWGRHGQDTVCHMQVGLIQEALYWVSGGKIFNVSEEACIARGDTVCTIVIDRSPLL